MASKKLHNVRPPQSDAACNADIAELGSVERDLDARAIALKDAIAALKTEHEEAARPVKERMAELVAGIEMFASSHRDRLTNGNRRKYHDFPAGRVAWREQPPSVRVTKAKEAELIEALKRRAKGAFVRVKRELNKEVLAEHPDVIEAMDGLTLVRPGEAFVVSPVDGALSEDAA